MKRFQFKQNGLLRLKKQFLRLADLDVTRTLLNLEQARHQLATLRDDFSRMAAEITQDATSACRYELLTSQRLSDYFRSRSDDIQQQIATAQAEYHSAREKRRGLAIEVESLHALRDGQWEKYRAEQNSHQTRELDQLVMNRWHGDRQREAEAHD